MIYTTKTTKPTNGTLGHIVFTGPIQLIVTFVASTAATYAARIITEIAVLTAATVTCSKTMNKERKPRMKNAGSNQGAGPTETDPSLQSIEEKCERIRHRWSPRRKARAKIEQYGRDKHSAWVPPVIRIRDCGIEAVEEIGNE